MGLWFADAVIIHMVVTSASLDLNFGIINFISIKLLRCNGFLSCEMA